jgi:hypothetical protein
VRTFGNRRDHRRRERSATRAHRRTGPGRRIRENPCDGTFQRTPPATYEWSTFFYVEPTGLARLLTSDRNMELLMGCVDR